MAGIERLLDRFGRCHLTALEGLPLSIVVVGGDGDVAFGPTIGERWHVRHVPAPRSRRREHRAARAIDEPVDLVIWFPESHPTDELVERLRPGGLLVTTADGEHRFPEIDRASDPGGHTVVVRRRPTHDSSPPSPLASSRPGRMAALGVTSPEPAAASDPR